MTTELKTKRCLPCEGGIPVLTSERVKTLLSQLKSDWELSASGAEVIRTFQFNNYYETMAFVNAVAWIAHGENHHPDLTVSYNQCIVRYITHAVGGLTENDFICAAKIDALSG